MLYAISGASNTRLDARATAAVRFACEYPQDIRASELLLVQTKADDFAIRADAVFLLGAFPSEQNIKLMISFLGDEISDVHFGAVHGLRLADTREAREAVDAYQSWKFSNIRKTPTRMLEGLTLIGPLLVFTNYTVFDSLYSEHPSFPAEVPQRPLSLWSLPLGAPVFAIWATGGAIIGWLTDGLILQVGIGVANLLSLGAFDVGEPWSFEEWSIGGSTLSGRAGMRLVQRLQAVSAACKKEQTDLKRLSIANP